MVQLQGRYELKFDDIFYIIPTCKNSTFNSLEIEHSIVDTTRSPRPGEENGKDYHFVTKETFLAAVERKEFIEHAIFGGNM
jgi:guanylate kinase